MEQENGLVCAKSNMAEDGKFRVRKQHLLTSYFDLGSAEELENCLVNYQHASALLTMDCTAIVKHTPDCDVTRNETIKYTWKA